MPCSRSVGDKAAAGLCGSTKSDPALGTGSQTLWGVKEVAEPLSALL